jgi:hypothetical protein
MKIYKSIEMFGLSLVIVTLMIIYEQPFLHWQSYAIMFGCVLMSSSNFLQGKHDVL